MQKNLNIGDVVYILGLQIIVFNRYIFINNPDDNVNVRCHDLRRMPKNMPELKIDDDDDFEDVPDDYFFRAHRFKSDVDTYELKLDSPPTIQGGDDLPLIMLIGPSMTMGWQR